jgi:RNA polymerase sigma factor (sigma-70 family)
MCVVSRAVEDAALVEGVLAGDGDALARIYDRYADRLYDFCAGMVGPHDAADAVQEAFVCAARSLPTLRDHSKLRPWLYTIARREAVRARARRVAAEELPDVIDLDGVEPDGWLDRAEAVRLVEEASAGLSGEDRTLLALLHRHDLTPSEAAEVLGLDAANVHSRAHRVRERFERAVRGLLVAQRGVDQCPELARVLDGWDGVWDPLWRKRVARHADECETCGQEAARLTSPAALFGVVPLLAAPILMKAKVVAAMEAALTGAAAAAGTAVAGGAGVAAGTGAATGSAATGSAAAGGAGIGGAGIAAGGGAAGGAVGLGGAAAGGVGGGAGLGAAGAAAVTSGHAAAAAATIGGAGAVVKLAAAATVGVGAIGAGVAAVESTHTATSETAGTSTTLVLDHAVPQLGDPIVVDSPDPAKQTDSAAGAPGSTTTAAPSSPAPTAVSATPGRGGTPSAVAEAPGSTAEHGATPTSSTLPDSPYDVDYVIIGPGGVGLIAPGLLGPQTPVTAAPTTTVPPPTTTVPPPTTVPPTTTTEAPAEVATTVPTTVAPAVTVDPRPDPTEPVIVPSPTTVVTTAPTTTAAPPTGADEVQALEEAAE